MLILMLLHFFVLTPGRFLGRAFQMSAALFLSLALLAGILALQQRVVRRLGIILVAGAITFRVTSIINDAHWLHVCDTIFTLLSLIALIVIVFRIVTEEGPVSAHRVRGAVALYLLIAILFAFLYGLTEAISPGAFNIPGEHAGVARGETFYYFSIVTLTTVGFGDITAVHPFVRSLVMLEALIGQLYPAILIARLVTLQLETRRSGK
jgi:voltage-gated potassium channel Kch